MFSEAIKPIGVVNIKHIRPPNLEFNYQVNNLVVNSGLAFITSRLSGVVDNVMSHMAVGNDNTAPTGTQTDLISMIGARVALDSTNRTTINVANDTIQYITTFIPGVSTGTLQEAAIFNNSIGGIMLARVNFAAINKLAADTVVITWQITFASP